MSIGIFNKDFSDRTIFNDLKKLYLIRSERLTVINSRSFTLVHLYKGAYYSIEITLLITNYIEFAYKISYIIM